MIMRIWRGKVPEAKADACLATAAGLALGTAAGHTAEVCGSRSLTCERTVHIALGDGMSVAEMAHLGPKPVHIDPGQPEYPLGYWNWITFAAADFDRSAAFYDRILGFMGYRRTIEAEDFIMWQTLFGAVALKPAAADRGAPDSGSPGIAEFIFFAPNAQDVDRFAALLRGTGVGISAGPRLFPEMMEGMYGIFFLDPDGTRLGLVHQPANFP